MSDYRGQLAGVVRAVELHEPLGYSWFGRRSPALPARIRKILTPQSAREHLLYSLRFQLYRGFYCQGGALVRTASVAPAPPGYTALAQRLAAANAGTGSWEAGWVLAEQRDGLLLVVRDGLALAVAADAVAAVGALEPGAQLRLRLPQDLFGISPGYYMAVGDVPPEAGQVGPLLRFYWNINADGAVALVALLTAALNAARVPFRLKTLSNPAAYIRCDAAVLYLRGAHFAAASAALAATYSELRDHLAPAVPALTLPLAPGLGMAEDPGKGESFGLQRCGLLAEGLINAHQAGLRGDGARLAQLVSHLNAAGIDAARPYLGPGSQAEYTLPLVPATPSRRASQSAETSVEPLAVARAVARQLDDTAIWHEDRCNWIGAVEIGARHGGTAYQALGADLYGGTAGVGLFCAELWRVTNEEWVRRLALGALRHALNRAEAIAPAQRLGLFNGWAGLGLVLARAGRLLDDAELGAAGQALLAQCSSGREPGAADLANGRAGTIMALLAGHDADQPGVLGQAEQLGDELLAAATRSAAGWRWRTAALPHRPGLTGYAHGTAGIAAALLELYARGGATRFRDAAEQALAYERHWFDEQRGNWADLRYGPSRGRQAVAWSTAWCHGAPGIVLSRLRAFELLGAECYRQDALVGLETSRQVCRAALDRPSADFSLCHGIAGLAEVVLTGAAALDADGAAGEQAVLIGAARYATGGRDWPLGIAGTAPGLMLGLAGIGLFYLRRHDPSTPTPLLPMTLAAVS